MAETRHAGPARRTFSDRYQDWTARNQARMARRPLRAVVWVGGFMLIYLGSIVLGAVQYHRVNPLAVVFLLGYPALMAVVLLRARRTLSRRHVEAAKVPGSQTHRFVAASFAALAALGIAGTVAAALHDQPKLAMPIGYVAAMALLVAVLAWRYALALDSPQRRLPERIAAKVARFPQMSAGAFVPGNHRVTLRLCDGREVHRVFVMYDHIIWRVGRRHRLDFSAADVVDAENEVEAPATMPG